MLACAVPALVKRVWGASEPSMRNLLGAYARADLSSRNKAEIFISATIIIIIIIASTVLAAVAAPWFAYYVQYSEHGRRRRSP